MWIKLSKQVWADTIGKWLGQAVHVQHVQQDVNECDDARGPLQCVANVAGGGIIAGVWQAALNDDHADDRVEQDRNENEDPLD